VIYHGRVRARGVLIVGVVAVLVGCASRPIERRTTQGPTADQLWAWRMKSQLGREPSFDERRHFDDQLELHIGRYLREHPEDASSLGVTAFRFDRQVSVGMSRGQVAILLGPPVAETSDRAAMAKAARKFWPDIEPRARAAWMYPLGWTVYFGEGERVVDITQFHPPGKDEGT
jgi:hypothetical protein